MLKLTCHVPVALIGALFGVYCMRRLCCAWVIWSERGEGEQGVKIDCHMHINGRRPRWGWDDDDRIVEAARGSVGRG